MWKLSQIEAQFIMNLLSHLLAVAGFMWLVLLCNVWRVKSFAHRGKGRSAPEPSGAWPFIGHLHLLNSPMPIFRTLTAMADKHGPVFMIRLGMHRALVVSSHKAVKECLTTNDKAFASRPISSAGKLLGYNYAGFGFAPYGPLWREMRKLSVTELLSNRRLNELKHVLVSELDVCIRDLYPLGKETNWVNPIKVAMSEWLEQLTFNVVLRMVAGKRYVGNGVHGNEEARHAIAVIKKFMSLTGAFVASDVIPFVEWMDLQGHLGSMKRVAEQLDPFVEGWVEEHVTKLKSDPGSRQDFIDVMLSVLKDNSIFGHTRETVIKATSQTLIVGGSDTTSIVSTWILSALLNNRHALKRAQEEIDLKVGRGRWVEESDIENLIYLQAVVKETKETLRLYPPAPLSIPHEAVEDCNVCEYHIPKGTRLFVNVWKLHRDPGVWPDPEEFQPKRFLTTNANLNVFGQYFELIPFSSGRRSCPGIALALQILHLTVARLLQGYDMTTPLNAPVDMTECIGITMPRATPLEVMLTPRLPSLHY
ncbi:cytochrome P450 CYP82D47-like [Vitis riparia]|uniref:cytochrome P450 CYP82D47-like n=1 Tax=Vitis riparia TaxID=96939 RepID=UPI00155A4C1A|nr:cytochrome P450 CYP82D47-like [Vitis riparia]